MKHFSIVAVFLAIFGCTTVNAETIGLTGDSVTSIAYGSKQESGATNTLPKYRGYNAVDYEKITTVNLGQLNRGSAFARLDYDVKDDLIVWGTDTLDVLKGSGTEPYQESLFTYTFTGSTIESITAIDVFNRGVNDLIVWTSTGDYLIQNQLGEFGPFKDSYTTHIEPISISNSLSGKVIGHFSAPSNRKDTVLHVSGSSLYASSFIGDPNTIATGSALTSNARLTGSNVSVIQSGGRGIILDDSGVIAEVCQANSNSAVVMCSQQRSSLRSPLVRVRTESGLLTTTVTANSLAVTGQGNSLNLSLMGVRTVLVGDHNKDGTDDLWVVHSNGVLIIPQTINGTLSSCEGSSCPMPYQGYYDSANPISKAYFRDVNFDSEQDVVLWTSNNEITVLQSYATKRSVGLSPLSNKSLPRTPSSPIEVFRISSVVGSSADDYRAITEAGLYFSRDGGAWTSEWVGDVNDYALLKIGDYIDTVVMATNRGLYSVSSWDSNSLSINQLSSNIYQCVSLKDVNHDELADITASSSARVDVLTATHAPGSFSPPVAQTLTSLGCVTVIDENLDGNQDFLTYGSTGNVISNLRNNRGAITSSRSTGIAGSAVLQTIRQGSSKSHGLLLKDGSDIKVANVDGLDFRIVASKAYTASSYGKASESAFLLDLNADGASELIVRYDNGEVTQHSGIALYEGEIYDGVGESLGTAEQALPGFDYVLGLPTIALVGSSSIEYQLPSVPSPRKRYESQSSQYQFRATSSASAFNSVNAIGDLDSDGTHDLVFGISGRLAVSKIGVAGQNEYALATRSMDNDNYLLVDQPNRNSDHCDPSPSDRDYVCNSTYKSYGFKSLVIFDQNGDGRNDILAIGTNSYRTLFGGIYQRDRTEFEDKITSANWDSTTAYQIDSAEVGDFNGDGRPDFWLDTDGVLTDYFLLNNGNTTPEDFSRVSITPPASLLPSVGLLSAAVVDANGDGIDDLLACHANEELRHLVTGSSMNILSLELFPYVGIDYQVCRTVTKQMFYAWDGTNSHVISGAGEVLFTWPSSNPALKVYSAPPFHNRSDIELYVVFSDQTRVLGSVEGIFQTIETTTGIPFPLVGYDKPNVRLRYDNTALRVDQFSANGSGSDTYIETLSEDLSHSANSYRTTLVSQNNSNSYTSILISNNDGIDFIEVGSGGISRFPKTSDAYQIKAKGEVVSNHIADTYIRIEYAASQTFIDVVVEGTETLLLVDTETGQLYTENGAPLLDENGFTIVVDGYFEGSFTEGQTLPAADIVSSDPAEESNPISVDEIPSYVDRADEIKSQNPSDPPESTRDSELFTDGTNLTDDTGQPVQDEFGNDLFLVDLLDAPLMIDGEPYVIDPTIGQILSQSDNSPLIDPNSGSPYVVSDGVLVDIDGQPIVDATTGEAVTLVDLIDSPFLVDGVSYEIVDGNIVESGSGDPLTATVPDNSFDLEDYPANGNTNNPGDGGDSNTGNGGDGTGDNGDESNSSGYSPVSEWDADTVSINRLENSNGTNEVNENTSTDASEVNTMTDQTPGGMLTIDGHPLNLGGARLYEDSLGYIHGAKLQGKWLKTDADFVFFDDMFAFTPRSKGTPFIPGESNLERSLPTLRDQDGVMVYFQTKPVVIDDNGMLRLVDNEPIRIKHKTLVLNNGSLSSTEGQPITPAELSSYFGRSDIVSLISGDPLLLTSAQVFECTNQMIGNTDSDFGQVYTDGFNDFSHTLNDVYENGLSISALTVGGEDVVQSLGANGLAANALFRDGKGSQIIRSEDSEYVYTDGIALFTDQTAISINGQNVVVGEGGLWIDSGLPLSAETSSAVFGTTVPLLKTSCADSIVDTVLVNDEPTFINNVNRLVNEEGTEVNLGGYLELVGNSLLINGATPLTDTLEVAGYSNIIGSLRRVNELSVGGNQVLWKSREVFEDRATGYLISFGEFVSTATDDKPLKLIGGQLVDAATDNPISLVDSPLHIEDGSPIAANVTVTENIPDSPVTEVAVGDTTVSVPPLTSTLTMEDEDIPSVYYELPFLIKIGNTAFTEIDLLITSSDVENFPIRQDGDFGIRIATETLDDTSKLIQLQFDVYPNYFGHVELTFTMTGLNAATNIRQTISQETKSIYISPINDAPEFLVSKRQVEKLDEDQVTLAITESSRPFGEETETYQYSITSMPSGIEAYISGGQLVIDSSEGSTNGIITLEANDGADENGTYSIDVYVKQHENLFAINSGSTNKSGGSFDIGLAIVLLGGMLLCRRK